MAKTSITAKKVSYKVMDTWNIQLSPLHVAAVQMQMYISNWTVQQPLK